jgi:hypothetical protein
MTPRSRLFVALASVAAAGLLALLSAGRSWGRANLVAATGARVAVTATGRQAVPAVPALAVALLVLAVALLAARRTARRAVGVVVAAVGLTLTVVAMASPGAVGSALRHHAFGVHRAVGDPGLSAWAVVAAVAGVAATLAGAWAVVDGGRWPGLGSRYESPARRPAAPTAASVWDAIDRGDDPTVP